LKNGLGVSFKALLVVKDPRLLLLQEYSRRRAEFIDHSRNIISYCEAMVSNWNVLYDIEQKQAQSIMLVRYEGQGWKDELYQPVNSGGRESA